MRHIKIFTLLIVFAFFSQLSLKAQCLDFAKTKGFAELDTTIYIPEGRLNAFHLSQGDNMDIYKSFFRGRKYKIVVVGADNLPAINFKVTNFQRQVLFDSKAKDSAKGWEFESDKNQNLIISFEIPIQESGQAKTGCVAVIVGFKADF